MDRGGAGSASRRAAIGSRVECLPFDGGTCKGSQLYPAIFGGEAEGGSGADFLTTSLIHGIITWIA